MCNFRNHYRSNFLSYLRPHYAAPHYAACEMTIQRMPVDQPSDHDDQQTMQQRKACATPRPRAVTL
ncbi:MAG: hypothetical protein JKY90_03565 [Gammaproteobacteria bacterium]|nr:hypothetical protein [Gammaproteobacteria bacterium]